MITILSFIAKKRKEFMHCEVSYDLTTKEAIYSFYWSIDKKFEQKKYKSVIIPTALYQAHLNYSIQNGYNVIINPEI